MYTSEPTQAQRAIVSQFYNTLSVEDTKKAKNEVRLFKRDSTTYRKRHQSICSQLTDLKDNYESL